MQAVTKGDDTYLTVADMQEMSMGGSGKGKGEDVYLTLDAVAELVAGVCCFGFAFLTFVFCTSVLLQRVHRGRVCSY